MTKEELLKLAEALEDAAIDYGDRRNSCFNYEQNASRDELHEARDKLNEAISGLFATEPERPVVTEAYYIEPTACLPCSQCKFRKYDSFHNEMWCRHEPPPDGLPQMRIIGQWGHCGYWEEEERDMFGMTDRELQA